MLLKPMARVLLLLWAGAVLLACSDEPGSAQDEIREFVEAGVAAAENRSADDLKDMVHRGYLDAKGYDREQLAGLLRAYFFRHKNIHLFTRIEAIELLAQNQATVKLHVAMAGSVISDLDTLAALRARIYRFELRLVKEDDWLLQHANWARASIMDLE
ncbi:MAG: hypothetical protein OER87_01815 [Gammaproteobacteria bacterium]|nr:hypothetical protein [Gammaproteobacteria bacterium]